jgi:hypothetical protein
MILFISQTDELIGFRPTTMIDDEVDAKLLARVSLLREATKFETFEDITGPIH